MGKHTKVKDPNTPETRGGARPGSGRKPDESKEMSLEELQKFIAAEQRLEKETGDNVADIVLRLAHFGKTEKTQLDAARIYVNVMSIKRTESTVNNNWSTGPGIMMPPAKPNPVTLLTSDN